MVYAFAQQPSRCPRRPLGAKFLVNTKHYRRFIGSSVSNRHSRNLSCELIHPLGFHSANLTALLYETFTCGLVLWSSYSHRKVSGMSRPNILTVLIRDSLVWYVCLGVFLFLNALGSTTGTVSDEFNLRTVGQLDHVSNRSPPPLFFPCSLQWELTLIGVP